jgi:hypothetical protein
VIVGYGRVGAVLGRRLADAGRQLVVFVEIQAAAQRDGAEVVTGECRRPRGAGRRQPAGGETPVRDDPAGLRGGPGGEAGARHQSGAGLPVVCVETRHMMTLLKAQQINKSDRNGEISSSTSDEGDGVPGGTVFDLKLICTRLSTAWYLPATLRSSPSLCLNRMELMAIRKILLPFELAVTTAATFSAAVMVARMWRAHLTVLYFAANRYRESAVHDIFERLTADHGLTVPRRDQTPMKPRPALPWSLGANRLLL